MKQFGKINYPPEIRGRFNNFITTEFDDSLTVEMQLRRWLKTLVEVVDVTNEMSDYLNDFMSKFDDELYKTLIDVLIKWREDGILQSIFEKIYCKYVGDLIDRTHSEVNDLINSFKIIMDKQAIDFNEWFLSIQDILNDVDPGGVLLNEIINSRTDSNGLTHKDLPTRLNVIDEIMNQIRFTHDLDVTISNVEGGFIPTIKDFYDKHVSDIIHNDDSVTINLINDLHVQRSVYPQPMTDHGIGSTRGYQYLMLHGLFSKFVDCTIVNGDQVHGREPIDLVVNRNKLVKQLCDLYHTPVYYNLGNHEDGNCYKVPKTKENLITKKEMLSIYQLDSFNQVLNFSKQRLKVLIISVYDNPEIFENGVNIHPRDNVSVITNETFDFIKKELECTPEDFYVVGVMHNIIANNNSNYAINHNELVQLFQSFQQSTSVTIKGNDTYYPIDTITDFREKPKHRFIGLLGGHRHYDETKQDRCWYDITRTCQVPSVSINDASGQKRVINTDSEIITDFVNINTVTKKMTLQRFGNFGETKEYDFGGDFCDII